MNEAALRKELMRIGRSLHARGYVHGTTGNLSARLDDGVLITATDACLGELDDGSIVKVDIDGQAASATARPSKTLALHRRIYAADPDARCVIHTHSSHLVRASRAAPIDEARDDFLRPITPYFVMKVGHVPLIPYHRPGSPAVADEVARRIVAMRDAGTPIRAVLLDRLGPNVWHESPAQASAVLEELEETARLWLMTRPEPLSPERIDELRAAFGARW